MLRNDAGQGPAKCRFAGEHIPKRHAQGVNVGTHVFILLLQLFRTGKIWRAHEPTRCEAVHGGVLSDCGLNETEVDHLHEHVSVALAYQHEIGWFDVPVHKVALLSRDECAPYLLGDFKGQQAIQRAITLNKFFHGFPVDKLHGIVVTVAALPEVKNRGDVAMPQLRRRSSLPEKPLFSRAAAQKRRRDDLQRHVAVQTGVKGFVSHAHAALAKLDMLSLVVLKKLVMLESVHYATSHLACSPTKRQLRRKPCPPQRMQATRELIRLLCLFRVRDLFNRFFSPTAEP
jgi:hypothetical protein